MNFFVTIFTAANKWCTGNNIMNAKKITKSWGCKLEPIWTDLNLTSHAWYMVHYSEYLRNARLFLLFSYLCAWICVESRGALNTPCLVDAPRCFDEHTACDKNGTCRCVDGFFSSNNQTCSQYRYFHFFPHDPIFQFGLSLLQSKLLL